MLTRAYLIFIKIVSETHRFQINEILIIGTSLWTFGSKIKLFICLNLKISITYSFIINAFVILVNHLYLIWQMKAGIKPENVQRDFLKFTAQKMQKDLKFYSSEFLNEFRVIAKEREFQYWKRKPFNIELRSDAVFIQKLEYIHENPVKAGLCKFAEEYYYHQPSFIKHELAILVF